MKGLKDENLSDYIKTTDVVRGTRSLNEFIGRLLNESVETLQTEKAILGHAKMKHPFDALLDRKL